jgi:hypothetical protein
MKIWSVTIELAGGYPAVYLFKNEKDAEIFYEKMSNHHKHTSDETWVMWGGSVIVYDDHTAAINDELDGEPLLGQNQEVSNDS